MWNPGTPTVLATCTASGEVSIWELRGDSLILNKSKPTFGGSSICWSSKVCEFILTHKNIIYK